MATQGVLATFSTATHQDKLLSKPFSITKLLYKKKFRVLSNIVIHHIYKNVQRNANFQ